MMDGEPSATGEPAVRSGRRSDEHISRLARTY